MATPLHRKSTIDDIRQRFDNDVDRFSNLETGQAATIDAPLAMELITQAAIASTPRINRVLDIGLWRRQTTPSSFARSTEAISTLNSWI